MNRPAQIVLLIEDANHEKLVNRYLRKRGYSHHQIRIERSGGLTRLYEDFVKEVAGLREVLSRRSGALVIVADADDLSVAERIGVLDEKLSNADVSLRKNEEPIFFVVPRRNVETWIYYLAGNAVDEDSDYKPRCTSTMTDKAKPRFVSLVADGENPPDGCPPSLCLAREELRRLP